MCWLHSWAGRYAYPKRLRSWIMFKEVLRECSAKFEAKQKRFRLPSTKLLDFVIIGVHTAAQVSPSEMLVDGEVYAGLRRLPSKGNMCRDLY